VPKKKKKRTSDGLLFFGALVTRGALWAPPHVGRLVLIARLDARVVVPFVAGVALDHHPVWVLRLLAGAKHGKLGLDSKKKREGSIQYGACALQRTTYLEFFRWHVIMLARVVGVVVHILSVPR